MGIKIIPFGRGTVLELRSDRSWSDGHPMVLDEGTWYAIERWLRQNKIYYGRSGNTISFNLHSDVTMFMLKWAE